MTIQRIFFAFAFVLYSILTSQAQTPASVAAAFKEKYKDVKNVKWNAGDNNTYEADFESDSIAYTATFTDDGKWIQTESSIDSEDLPQVIKDALSKQYDSYLVSDAELIDSNDQGRMYSVHIERGDETTMVLLNEDGKIIKNEKLDDEG